MEDVYTTVINACSSDNKVQGVTTSHYRTPKSVIEYIRQALLLSDDEPINPEKDGETGGETND